jgi:hypothetical protein
MASAFPERPAADQEAGGDGLSRFSRMELPYMPRFFDRAGSAGDSRIAPPAGVAFRPVDSVGTPELRYFAAQ